MKRNIPQALRMLADEIELEKKLRQEKIFDRGLAGLVEPIMPEEDFEGENPEIVQQENIPTSSPQSERIWKNSVAERVLKILVKQPSTTHQLSEQLDISSLVITSIVQYLLKQDYIRGMSRVRRPSHRDEPQEVVYYRTKKEVEILDSPAGFTPAKSGLTLQKK